MSPSRRKFITLVGGGAIFAASAGTAGFLTTRTPKTALQPWDLAGDYADPRERALSYAILAPNPHNLQPWQVQLEGDDAVAIYHDSNRRLPHTDPFDRQIIIGFGCFLEQMAIAASQEGMSVSVSVYPDGDAGPVARAVFAQGATPDPLGTAIMKRRSCKEPFTSQQVEADKIERLAEYATLVTDKARVTTLRDLTWKAWQVETLTPRTMQESVDLMRFGKSEINANPDGIDLGGPFLESLMLAGVLSREAQADPSSTGFQEGVKIYHEMLQSTPAYAVLTSGSNTRTDQIDVGRRWLRLNLATTQMGLSLHPVSQCLQEYPEMALYYERAHEVLAQPGQTVQMLGRLGYGPQTPRTPRWPLEAKLQTT